MIINIIIVMIIVTIIIINTLDLTRKAISFIIATKALFFCSTDFEDFDLKKLFEM